jgi:lipid-A-disaccharide synthase-like uncharacterized protein
MFGFLVAFLLLRRFRLPVFVRYAFAVFVIGLVIVVFIWTTNLFLTLNQRTSAPHVHTHRAQ